MVREKNIGIKLKEPKKSCEDKKCPFHGALRIRNKTFVGTVIATDVHKTATVEWTRRHFIPKYERHEKRRTRVRVHNPSCINAKKGDRVIIAQCRPLSKTKNFVIIENLGKEFGFEQKEEALEEAKVKEKKPEKEEKLDKKVKENEGSQG